MGSGKRTSMRRPLGLLTYGMRTEAERLRAEAARKAEEEAQAAQDFAMPWDDEAPVDVVQRVQEAVAKVDAQVQVPQAVAGIGTKYKPWAARITNMKQFLQFVIEKERFELVQPDMPQLNALAKKLTESMSATIPGTEAFRERIISGR